MRVRVNGTWTNSTSVWTDANRADRYVDRMNRGGLPAERIRVRLATTYVDGAVFMPHREVPAVLDAICDALEATR